MYEFERLGSATAYNGQYFDSLTEARWAAYFDAAGMPFIREPETFEFPAEHIETEKLKLVQARQLYTPDFFLPEQNAYIEVKNGNADDGTAFKLGKLALGSHRPGILVDGRPGSATMYVFSSTPYDFGERYTSYHGFSCNFLYQYHMLRPSERYPKLRSEMIGFYNAVHYTSFTIPTPEQASAALSRRRDLQEKPTVLENPENSEISADKA